MTKKNLHFALVIFFALLSPCLASAALTQEGYADLSRYSGLTNFDMDENGRIYAIADRKGGARLVCLDGGGNELASYGVTDGAEEITASPSGGAVFYRVPSAETGGRVYKVTGAGADGFKDGFTFGGIPVAVEKIEAVDDDGILIAWNAEYEEDAEFPDWLPKTVKIGLFSYSAAGEPEEVWTWTPQWLLGETNFDGNPYVKRLGDSWRYYLSFNPGSRDIFVYATHYRKFFHEPTGRNHYSRNVTHIYKASADAQGSLAEIPNPSFPDWTDIFHEPFYTSGGILLYRSNNDYSGFPNFVYRVSMADQQSRGTLEDEYAESWEDSSGNASYLGDVSGLPQAHVELVSHYLADGQDNLYLISGVRAIDTEETVSLALVKFSSSGVRQGETITGTNGADALAGGAGDDTLKGLAGNDALTGAGGNDRLEGGVGNDTYFYNLGDGKDTIFDNVGSNTLVIGAGIEPEGVKLTRSGRNGLDAVFLMPDGGSVTVEGWHNSLGTYQLADVQFANGTAWTKGDINGMPALYEGTEAGETLKGSPGGDIVLGRGGDDTLKGLAGDDTLAGGAGSDRLEGWTGDDVYVWDIGDGDDTIYDGFGDNTLRIGAGVDPDDVTYSRGGPGDHDAIFIMPDGGKVTVQAWFIGERYQLSEIRFADGTAWTKAEIADMLPLYGGSGTPGETITGSSGGDALAGGPGDDTLKGMAGDDALAGGAGHDRLEGGVGNDTYVYSLGDGRDTILDNLGTNALRLGAGINPADVKLTRDGTNFLNAVFVMPDGGRVTVEGWHNSLGTYQLSEIRFADGTVWTKAYVNSQRATLEGTGQGDSISGTQGDDIIYGYDGDDAINGQDGGDVLIGGLGDDFLQGWQGDDTYIWDPGDGNDTIYSQFGGEDTLQIGDGVDPTALSLSRSGNNLKIGLNDETGAVLTLQAWYSGASYQLSKIIFAEGTEWTKADINEIASGKAPFSTSPVRQGQTQAETPEGAGSEGPGGGCSAGALGLAALAGIWLSKRGRRS